MCDGVDQCGDKSDESTSICTVISKDCRIPKNAEGTTYNVGDCSNAPGVCKVQNGKTVEVSCKMGYTIAYSVNSSTVLPCPTKDWNPHHVHCHKCGRSNTVQGALSEGKFDTEPGKFPWHVTIYKSFSGTYSRICGGSLITPNIVLSAASCVFNVDGTTANPSNYRIIAAKFNRDYSPLDNVQERNVDKILFRRSFNGDINSYIQNVALLRVEKSFNINPLVQTVCLYAPNYVPFSLNSRVSVPGWGLSSSQVLSDSLKEAVFKITDIKNCQKLSRSVTVLRFFTHDKFCVLFNSGATGFNAIDTGTGIIIPSGGVNYLYGIVSAKVLVDSKFSIVTNITKQVNWIKKSIEQLAVRCNSGSFLCNSGLCIADDLKCNGNDDCGDGSDEATDLCPSNIPTGPVSSGSCTLPDYSKSNIFRKKGCNNESCNLIAKSSVPGQSVIITSCKPGYDFADSMPKQSGCVDGIFYPPLPACKKLCDPLHSESLSIQCTYRGDTVPCSKGMLPNTKATHDCKFQYRPQDPSSFKKDNICEQNGRWKYRLPVCISQCGRKIATDAITTISYGTPVKAGSYPWHVGLYYKKSNGYEQACGGSIVAPNVIVTAAHCVYDEKMHEVGKKEEILVVAGKYYRDIAVKDTNMQIRNVKKIEILRTYDGSATFYAEDISIIVTEKSFDLNNYILPVCLDRSINDNVPQPDPCTNGGWIAGWGLTENNVSSSELLEVKLPYVDLISCRRKNPSFSQFLTSDKFCADYVKGAGIQRGDSGGGYICVGEGGLHYLFGVASLKSRSSNDYGAFTNIVPHLRWVINQIDAIQAEADR